MYISDVFSNVVLGFFHATSDGMVCFNELSQVTVLDYNSHW